MRHLAIIGLALLLTGCVCVCIDDAGIQRLERWAEAEDGAAAPAARHFLIVRGTLMAGDGADVEQVLLESTVIRVPGDRPIRALEAATPHAAGGQARVWRAGREAPESLVMERADILAMPSIVSRVGESATVEVGETDADGAMTEGFHLTLDPTREGDQLVLRIAYRHHDDGAVARALPALTLSGPDGGTWIVEVEAAGTEATTEAADR